MANCEPEDASSPTDERKSAFSCSEFWDEQSLYEVLEVGASATLEEIKASWRRLVKVRLGIGHFLDV